MFGLRQVSALVLTSVLSASAFAAGYEKNILWSGRHAGVGGTSAAWASGGEALVFNPAGLATEQGKREVVGNISIISSQYKAPVVTDNSSMSSARKNSIVPAVFYGANPTEKLGYGIGLYASGGTTVEYKGIDLSTLGNSNRPDLKTELTAIEASVGAGYKVMPGLKVGAAYRFGIIEAELSSLTPIGGANVVQGSIQDIKGTQHGFRTGVQWAPEGKNYGLGLVYRSPLHFEASGDLSANLLSASASTPLTTSGRSTIKTIMPAQFNFGGYYNIVPDVWRAHAEYVWTQYSRNQTLDIGGTVTLPGPATVQVADINQRWRDQHNIRIGGEYLKCKYPIRFGYIWNSGVENPSFARSIFAAPGKANSFTLGTGRSTDKWDFNVATEYTVAKADNAVVTTSALTARSGKYTTSAVSLHTGVVYKF